MLSRSHGLSLMGACSRAELLLSAVEVSGAGVDSPPIPPTRTVSKLTTKEKADKERQATPTANLVSRRKEADVVERNLPSVSIVELHHHTSWLPFIR